MLTVSLAAITSFRSTAFAAVMTVDPGFNVTTFNVGFGVDGLAPGSGGVFGTDLYAAINTNGTLVRLDLDTGNVTPFITGLSVGANRPSGLAFDNGAFGTGQLYVSQNNGSVVAVSDTGTVTPLVSGGTLFSSNDLAFAPLGGAYGNNLFVTNGPFGFGNVSRVTDMSFNSVFVDNNDLAQVPVGIAFSTSGSAFGETMFLSVADGTIVEVDSTGTPLLFASGLGLAIDIAISTGGAFGEQLYVTDPNTQSILQVDSDGTVSTFASGFSFSSSGFDADLVFSPDGDTLFVSNGQDIVAISAGATTSVPEPSMILGAFVALGLGKTLRSGKRRD